MKTLIAFLLTAFIMVPAVAMATDDGGFGDVYFSETAPEALQDTPDATLLSAEDVSGIEPAAGDGATTGGEELITPDNGLSRGVLPDAITPSAPNDTPLQPQP